MASYRSPNLPPARNAHQQWRATQIIQKQQSRDNRRGAKTGVPVQPPINGRYKNQTIGVYGVDGNQLNVVPNPYGLSVMGAEPNELPFE